MAQYLRDLWYSWNSSIGFGTDWSINKGFLIAQIPETFFIFITNNLSLGQRLSFVFWFFVIGLSMYVFIRRFFADKEFWVFRVFSSLFYMYNFFLLQGWFITERGKFSLFVALPLGLLILYETLSKKIPPIKGAIYFSIIFLLFNGGGSAPLYGAILVTYLVTFLYLTFLNIWQDGVKTLLHSLKILFLFGIFTALLNSYWLIPQIYLLKNQYGAALAASGGIESILNWERAVSKNASLINLFRLQGLPDWYDSPNHAYSRFFLENPLLVVLSFLPISLIFLGLFLHQRFKAKLRQDRLFFLILLILIVSCVFASGSHEPFGFIYLFLVKFVPGFAIFRSAIYKFGPGVWFSLIFLSGYSLNFLLLQLDQRKKLAGSLGIVSIAVLILYHFPYFLSGFFQFDPPFTTRVTLPNYVQKTAQYMNEHVDPNSRVLILPEHFRTFPVDSYAWGFWSFDLLPRLSFSQSVLANEASSLPIIDSLYKAANDHNLPLFNQLSKSMGVDYVLWRSDILYHDKVRRASDFSSNLFFPKPSNTLQPTLENDQWKVYQLGTEPKVFTMASKAILAEVDVASFPRVLEMESLTEKDHLYILSSDVEKNSQIEGLDLNSPDIIESRCLNCHFLTDLQFPILPVELPHVSFLPSSLIYPYIVFKEKEALVEASASPVNKIDLELLFADKRIKEVLLLLRERNSKQVEEGLRVSTERYRSLINDVVAQIPQLSGQQQRQNQDKLLSHLRAHEKQLNPAPEITLELTEYLQKSIEVLENERISSEAVTFSSSEEAHTSKKYLVSVSQPGTYKLEVANSSSPHQRMLWQGKEIEQASNLTLERGEYKLELIYPEVTDLAIPLSTIIPDKLQKKHGDQTGFGIQDFSSSNDYFISFEYFVPSGQTTNFTILQDNDPHLKKREQEPIIDTTLEDDNKWQGYTYHFMPNEFSKEASILFTSYNSAQTTPKLELRNFKIRKVHTPTVFLIKQSLHSEAGSSSSDQSAVKFTRISPTKYSIHLDTVPETFFLQFKQSFNTGWGIYPPSTRWWQTLWTKPLAVDSHFIGNTYANTWLIKGNRDTDLLIFYRPQALFYLGLLISSLSFIFSIAYLMLQSKKRK